MITYRYRPVSYGIYPLQQHASVRSRINHNIHILSDTHIVSYYEFISITIKNRIHSDI